MFNAHLVMLLIQFNMHTAWASALLILGGRQCESLIRGMSDEFQDPALFFYGLLIVNQFLLQGIL